MTIPKYLLLTSEPDCRFREEPTYEFFLRIPVQSLILLKYSRSSSNTAYIYDAITLDGGTIIDNTHPVYGGGWLMVKYEVDNDRRFLRFGSLEEVEQFLLQVIL